VTLRELIAAHPERFHPQTWYAEEAFLDFECLSAIRLPEFLPCASPNGHELPRAAMLASLYLQRPDAPLWTHYLWCADTDHRGQRIYVGGVAPENGHRMEIHRHLHLTARWGVALW
jgi:hypothetical protein